MMSLFAGSPFDADVEKATDHKRTSEDWALIMEICDKVGNSTQHAKDCLRSIMKRLSNQDPHIVLLAITLLDACSNNCGKVFHLEIASREFEGQFIKLLNSNRNQPVIYEKLKALLKKWAENDYKSDPQLNLIPSLLNQLKNDHDFSTVSEPGPRKSYALSKDPNVVASAKEEEELAKAIELSLKESSKQSVSISHSSPSTKKVASLYPNVNSTLLTTSNTEGRKVKALYDFEAVEDNELTFSAGEIINILDDSDPNWWKGSNNRGEGLFPANFVTADLSVEPDQFTKLESNKKSVQFAEEVEVKTVPKEPEVVSIEIDEDKMDRLLHLLHEADPQSNSTDSQEMLDLEAQVSQMGPLIDTALEKVDKQHAQLTQLSSDLVEAMNLYHTLMREPAISSYVLPKMPPQQMVYSYPMNSGIYSQGPQQGPPQVHPQGMPSQDSHHQNAHVSMVHTGQVTHPQGLHAQGPVPQGHHPLQGSQPQGNHPQLHPSHPIFNGMPTGPQYHIMPNSQQVYDDIINSLEDTSISERHSMPLPTQNNACFPRPSYPPQTNPGAVPVGYMMQVENGSAVNQHTQFVPPNSQRLM
ncbi:hypothetical protein TKK_0012137 [Trichogramma kaykai]